MVLYAKGCKDEDFDGIIGLLVDIGEEFGGCSKAFAERCARIAENVGCGRRIGVLSHP
jgi:hypothetical protein